MMILLFGNTKQVIQDYDTVFDNSILFPKNDLLQITSFRIPGVPGLHFAGNFFVSSDVLGTVNGDTKSRDS